MSISKYHSSYLVFSTTTWKMNNVLLNPVFLVFSISLEAHQTFYESDN